MGSVTAQTLRQGLGRSQVSTLAHLKIGVTLGFELMTSTHLGGRICSLVSSRTPVAGAPASKSQSWILFLDLPVPLAPPVSPRLPLRVLADPAFPPWPSPSRPSRPSRDGSCGAVPGLDGPQEPRVTRGDASPSARAHLPLASHGHFSPGRVALQAVGGCRRSRGSGGAGKADGCSEHGAGSNTAPRDSHSLARPGDRGCR